MRTNRRVAAVGGALRSVEPDARANCTRFDASSTAACTGCRSSLAEMIGNRQDDAASQRQQALSQREPGICGELLRPLANAQSAASASVIQIRLSSSSIFGSIGLSATVYTAELALTERAGAQSMRSDHHLRSVRSDSKVPFRA